MFYSVYDVDFSTESKVACLCFVSHLFCTSCPLRHLSSLSFQSETAPTLYLRVSPE